jgi:aryl-alcohol dehydrogenase-like predicted oxidoreductase
MRTRRLGNSDLDITVIGFGAWAIGGGDWIFGWGPQDDAESVATIRRALDLGINWIDTAAVYGLGHSESVVAQALKELPAGRRPYVFTKSSLVWDDNRVVSHSLRKDSIAREVDGSLRRLGVDAIDLYQIHWPRWGSSPSGWDPGPVEEGWQAMADLQKAGKVRYIGVSNFTVDDLDRAHQVAPVTSVQPPYSLLRRDVEADVLPWARSHGAGVIVYSPMQSGLLTGAMTRERFAALPDNDWRRKGKYFQEPYFTQAMGLVDRLREIGARHGRSPGEVAIAWTLRHPAVTGAIVGARRPDQLDGIVGAASLTLADDDARQLENASV